MSPDIVIVGAGPVGLFTAIEAKLHKPDLNIKIIERNEEYSRRHILRLEKDSLVDSLTYKTYSSVRLLNGFVPTSDIENTFLTIALEMGIQIERGNKVEDSNALLSQYPSVRAIVGADGAHSVIRKQLFNDKKIIDTTLQYIVELKYKAKNSTSRLPVATYGPALGQVPYLLTENVGKEKNGETPVSLFVFVDEATYKEIRGKKGLQLSNLQPSSKRMTKLLNTIRPWLSLRKEALNEKIIIGSEQINGVELSIFQSATFAKKIEKKHVYLVGDAAAGVPYFRALNAGLIAATITAKTFALNTEPDLAALNGTLSKLMDKEITNAKKQNDKVNLGRAANFVLANGSKIITGALLKPQEEAAMLNARIEKTNIIRRHPRLIIAFSVAVLTMVIIACVTIPSFPLGVACFLSIAGGISLSFIPSTLIKMTSDRCDRLKGEQNLQYAPPLPWEADRAGSKNALSKLSKQVSSVQSFAASITEIEHFPNPIKIQKAEILLPESNNYFPKCV